VGVIFSFCLLAYVACCAVNSYWLLPALVLKRMVIGNFERGSHDSEMSDAIDFVVDCVSRVPFIAAVFESSDVGWRFS